LVERWALGLEDRLEIEFDDGHLDGSLDGLHKAVELAWRYRRREEDPWSAFT